jgi:hypothetical protein
MARLWRYRAVRDSWEPAFQQSRIERSKGNLVSASMTKIFSIFAAALICFVSPSFAGSKSGDACCEAKKAAHSEGMACIDYASLNLTADQKSKVEAWQAECTKAGCTKESRRAFLKQAKGILSAEQFTKLKQQCGARMSDKAKA